ncbi:hypothetical protein CLU81_3568 [Flavobacterium sp. 9]|uniref:hypothetical protein n=1 Tax=Flavobacterium sp. 9 TaxID=2035198 RepID=UPI000C19A180|nr:hypothetical protein [Flavobacterium sp. 9]PIF32998.1 hypothetical protein CLU81_3568 [Flavobacterium sp. 9]
MEILQNWIKDGCDYATGIIIYGNLPKHNSLLLKNFKKKNNSFNREKLKYELNKFIEKYDQNVFVSNVQKTVLEIVKPVLEIVPKNDQKQAVLFHQLPETLRPVLLEANQLFKENCMLKVQLNELPQHAEKAAIAIQIRIHSNFKKNELCWQKIDLFLEKRIISDTPKSEFSELTPAGLLKRQQLLYASISKLNTRLKQNRVLLNNADNVANRAKIERMINKQEQNLINKNETLITISNLIDGY